MTEAEKKILDMLCEANNEFIKLESVHINESREWCMKLHDIQRMITHRTAYRLHPEIFNSPVIVPPPSISV